MLRIMVACLLLASSACLAQGESATQASRDLGEIDFPTSGSVEAQKHFIEGVLWLHSFEYPEAREAFQEAQQADPDFAMAYWGEAMTWNHPLWNRENRATARKALEKLAPSPAQRLAKAPTAREKDYLRAVEVLFGDEEKTRRDEEYAELMAEMRERYPDDLEAASFYALALLGTCHGERHIPTYMRAAAVVEEVFIENPRHPGALHYLIHSYDDPVHAPLGLRQARLYSEIAPSAGHALHMPSHIFLALGMWDETEKSNIDSYAAGEERRERRNLPVAERGYHALYWWHYALLQQGRYREALQKLAIAQKDASQSSSARIRYHQAVMNAAQIVESRRFEDLPPPASLEDLSPSAQAAQLFARGWAALETGRLEEAQGILEDINERRRRAEQSDRGSSEEYSRVGPPPTREARIMASQLEGLLAQAKGDGAAALRALRQAAEWEEDLAAGFGPPNPVKPSHELWGEALLAAERPEEAQKVFQAALERHPNRALSLLGLMRSADAAGDQETAREARGRLAQVWDRADEGVAAPELSAQPR